MKWVSIEAFKSACVRVCTCVCVCVCVCVHVLVCVHMSFEMVEFNWFSIFCLVDSMCSLVDG